MRNKEKLVELMRRAGFVESRAAWVEFAREAAKRVDPDEWWPSQGYERINVADGQHLLPDGRRVMLDIDGNAWALRSDVYRAQVEADLAAALKTAEASRPKQRPAKPGESLTSVLCPSCQSTMAKSPVCPNCAKGKAGYKILCICTECGHEVFL